MRYLTYGSSVLPSDHRHTSRLSMGLGKGCGVAKWIPVLAMTLLVSACTGSSDSAAPETSVDHCGVNNYHDGGHNDNGG